MYYSRINSSSKSCLDCFDLSLVVIIIGVVLYLTLSLILRHQVRTYDKLLLNVGILIGRVQHQELLPYLSVLIVLSAVPPEVLSDQTILKAGDLAIAAQHFHLLRV